MSKINRGIDARWGWPGRGLRSTARQNALRILSQVVENRETKANIFGVFANFIRQFWNSIKSSARDSLILVNKKRAKLEGAPDAAPTNARGNGHHADFLDRTRRRHLRGGRARRRLLQAPRPDLHALTALLAATGRVVRLALVPIVVSAAVAAQDGVARLSLPIDCEPGSTCWVFAYFDADPGPGTADYRCGRRSYNGHGGTDFAIGGLEDMARGVAVLAAAPGRVVGLRDGMVDVSVLETGRAGVRRRECGNGVRIDHGAGLQTQYCHLRRGSLRVRKGMRVRRGQRLGLVGLSGLTEAPHLHLSVFYRGRKIDPFRGPGGGPRCAAGTRPLWTKSALAAVRYRPVVIHEAGFARGRIARRQYRRGDYPRIELSSGSPAIVFWADILGLKAGDRVELTLRGPDRRAAARSTRTIAKHYAKWFGYVGKRRRGGLWARGDYAGQVSVIRNGRVVARYEREILVR